MAGEPHSAKPLSPAAASPPVRWPRLVLLVALLNVPLFFDGCESKQTQFSAGAVVPFAELTTKDQPWGPVSIAWWSPWRCAVNFFVIGGALWLAWRNVAWIARVAESRWTVGVLAGVALVFDSWLVVPLVWPHLVFMPTLQLSMLLQSWLRDAGDPSTAVHEWVLRTSARLYYLACLLLVGGVTFGLRVFFRRFFFVQSGHWWQVQLGGLLIVVLVLGTAIGLGVRLWMQQQ